MGWKEKTVRKGSRRGGKGPDHLSKVMVRILMLIQKILSRHN